MLQRAFIFFTVAIVIGLARVGFWDGMHGADTRETL